MKDKNNNQEDDSIESDLTFIENDEDGEELSSKNVVKKLRENLKLCKKEKEGYLVGWQRARADYINLQKELDQVRINSSTLAKENFAFNLLPVIDSFDMAFNNKNAWEKIDEEWRRGIEYIYQQLITSLSVSGVEKIDKTNIPFNPKIHDSVKIINTTKKSNDNLIAKVIQTGYQIGDRIIRPARVNIYEYKK